MPRHGLREILRLSNVIARGQLMHHEGDEDSYVGQSELKIKEMMQVKHCILMNSGTNALISALHACGIGVGDEVIVPAYTWVSTISSVLSVGAKPIIVNIDDSLTIDIEELKSSIGPNTKAVIPVHMLNLVCNMDEICKTAKMHGLYVIEDSCQAVGVTYKGRFAGTIGNVGAFSFNHYKNVSTGEGGCVVTNDGHISRQAQVFHDIGSYSDEYSKREINLIGQNNRISELTGAVLLSQLEKLPRHIARLKAKRERVVEGISRLPGVRISPHNDPPSAVGVSLLVEDQKCLHMVREQGFRVTRISDIGRHDFRSWMSVVNNVGLRHFLDFKGIGRVPLLEDGFVKTMKILSRSYLVE